MDELYRLAGIYNTCIICVLHFVPNGIKLRGHIGSELQRKSAAILSIEKDENPAFSVVKALKVEEQIYYDAFDVAKILRIHFKTALRWGKEGKLPSFKIGNRRYFPSEGILAYKKTIW